MKIFWTEKQFQEKRKIIWKSGYNTGYIEAKEKEFERGVREATKRIREEYVLTKRSNQIIKKKK